MRNTQKVNKGINTFYKSQKNMYKINLNVKIFM